MRAKAKVDMEGPTADVSKKGALPPEIYGWPLLKATHGNPEDGASCFA